MEGDHCGRKKNATEDYLPSAKSAVEEDPLPWRLSLDSFRIEKQDSTDHSRQTWSSFLHTSSSNAFLASIFSLIFFASIASASFQFSSLPRSFPFLLFSVSYSLYSAFNSSSVIKWWLNFKWAPLVVKLIDQSPSSISYSFSIYFVFYFKK